MKNQHLVHKIVWQMRKLSHENVQNRSPEYLNKSVKTRNSHYICSKKFQPEVNMWLKNQSQLATRGEAKNWNTSKSWHTFSMRETRILAKQGNVGTNGFRVIRGKAKTCRSTIWISQGKNRFQLVRLNISWSAYWIKNLGHDRTVYTWIVAFKP